MQRSVNHYSEYTHKLLQLELHNLFTLRTGDIEGIERLLLSTRMILEKDTAGSNIGG
jgi:hypothetical protein